MMPLPPIAIADGLIEAMQRHSPTAAKANANFADTLAAVPLFSTWTNATSSSISPVAPAAAGISTQATSNRRHDGRRRSHS